MFSLLVTLLLILWFAPIIISWRTSGRFNELSRRLTRVEDALDGQTLDRAPRADASPTSDIRDLPQAPSATGEPDAPPRMTADNDQEDIGETPVDDGGDIGPASAPPVPPPPEEPPPGQGFEERLGSRWAVWAGGAALALGGLLLVRYSIEAGLFGPEFRVAAGALIAAGLVAAGEWMRRNDIAIPVEALPQAHIPSVLTAAGTVIAFATIYAAHALYGFLGPAAAFILLGLTGVITMLAAALHGPWLAGLGLLGAFATPLLIQSDSVNPWPVVLYLSVVAAAAYLLARTRRWRWLASATVIGVALWAWLMAIADQAASPEAPLAAAVFTFIQLALAAIFLAVEPYLGQRDDEATFDRFAAVALAALTAIGALIILTPQLDFNSRQMFAVVSIALLTATAWRIASVAVAGSIAATLSVATLLAWPDLALPPDIRHTAPWAKGVLRLPENTSRFLSFAALATLIPAAAMVLRLQRGPLLASSAAALYAAAATVPPLLALILAYLRVTQFDVSIPFAIGGAGLAIAFAVLSEHFHRANQANASPAHDMAAGIFAAAALAAFALALTMALSRGYLTVAFALAALGAAYIAARRDLSPLRAAVAALGLIVLARVAIDPRIMGGGVGATPILNWLLIGYGVPAAAFYFAARWLETRRTDFAVRLSDSLAVIFAGLLLFFQVRHLTNAGDVLHAGANHVESGLQVFVSLALSFALARMNLARANPVFEWASLMFAVISIFTAVGSLMIFANPALTGETVGGSQIFSSLMPAYLLPGIAALFVARHTRAFRPRWFVRALGVLGVALIAFYATLEVRHGFKGPDISFWRSTSDAEQWAYSAAWLMLGIAFLAYGLLRGSLEARAASAALIVLAALKITLFDLAGIDGFWRALSFLFLGAVLIGIGLVYQKLIFGPPRNQPAVEPV